MQGKKRILALVGVPLGASLALAPAFSAEAHAATPGKSTVSGAALLPSIAPTASCSISGVEGPNDSATLTGAGFTKDATVSFISGKRTIATAKADAAGAVSTTAVVKADDAVTAQEGANQQGCLNLVKPSTTTGTTVPGTDTNVPGTAADREAALAAGENDGDATCRQKVDQFKLNADKSASFRADYASGFNNKVAATAGCAQMLAQLRSGVPVGQNQTQEQGQGQGQGDRGQGDRGQGDRGQGQGQGDRGGGRGNR